MIGVIHLTNSCKSDCEAKSSTSSVNKMLSQYAECPLTRIIQLELLLLCNGAFSSAKIKAHSQQLDDWHSAQNNDLQAQNALEHQDWRQAGQQSRLFPWPAWQNAGASPAMPALVHAEHAAPHAPAGHAYPLESAHDQTGQGRCSQPHAARCQKPSAARCRY